MLSRQFHALFDENGVPRDPRDPLDENEVFRRRQSTVDEGVPFYVPRRSFSPEGEELLSPAPARHDQIMGLVMVTFASLIFGTAAMFVKLSPLSGLFIMEVRCAVQWVLSVASILIWKASNPNAKRTIPDMLFGENGVRKWIVLRSVVHWIFMVSYWLAARLMPFGNCTALVYVGPLFTALPAYLFLGEHITPQFLLIAPMSFAGLLMVTQPSFIFGAGNDQISAIGLAFAITAALSLIVLPVITKCGKDSHWLQIEHGSTFIGAFILTPIAILLENQLDASKGPLWSEFTEAWDVLSKDYMSIAIVLSIPCAQFVGLALQTIAYQVAEAGKCSLMLYLMIPQSYVMQYFVFHNPMTTWGNVGMALIVAACVLNGWTTIRNMNAMIAVTPHEATTLPPALKPMKP